MEFTSPLRYPGGKGKITPFIKLIFKMNKLIDGCYVEPYAGGASVALSLLYSEYITKAYINDIDRSVYAFWYSVLNQTDELCRLIKNTPVNIEQWYLQREVQKFKESASLLELGFSTFFQNRANRSGIIKAGVIGGVKQTGKWKVDARFNKNDLIKRIERVALYKDRLIISNMDAIEFINEIRPQLPPKTLLYFDPPYYLKGKDLYENHYKYSDHQIVANLVNTLNNNFSWVVSYDNHPAIAELYTDFRSSTYWLNYSAASPSQGEEIIVFSDDLKLPVLFENLKRTAQLAIDI